MLRRAGLHRHLTSSRLLQICALSAATLSAIDGLIPCAFSEGESERIIAAALNDRIPPQDVSSRDDKCRLITHERSKHNVELGGSLVPYP